MRASTATAKKLIKAPARVEPSRSASVLPPGAESARARSRRQRSRRTLPLPARSPAISGGRSMRELANDRPINGIEFDAGVLDERRAEGTGRCPRPARRRRSGSCSRALRARARGAPTRSPAAAPLPTFDRPSREADHSPANFPAVREGSRSTSAGRAAHGHGLEEGCAGRCRSEERCPACRRRVS